MSAELPPQQAVSLKVDQTLQQAIAHHHAGRLQEAEQAYRAILQIRPDHPEANHNLGVLTFALQQPAIGLLHFEAALAADPSVERYWLSYADARYNHGNAQVARGEFAAARASYERALEIKPDFTEAYSNLGAILQELGRLDDAVANCERALLIKPDYAEAHNSLGNAQRDLEQLDAAMVSYRRALAIKPDCTEAHNNLGNIHSAVQRLDDAMTSYRRALAIKPDYTEAHNNLGNAQRCLGHLDHAVASYKRALEIDPDYAKAHYNLGFVLLLSGNFAEGWKHYESRVGTKARTHLVFPPKVAFPQWRGESLVGKSMLVWCEQGLGDQIQFCRFLPILRSLGAEHITLVCSAPLTSLLQRFAAADKVLAITEAGAVPIHDYWTFPLSIPRHCLTTLEDIPAAIPYLYADDRCQQEMATQLADIREFKVGLCWQGDKGYGSDAERSPGLDPFKKLLRLGGVRYFTLQPGRRDQFLSLAGSTAQDLGHEIDEFTPPFEETAALIMNLDLVITCDTSVGHLAGALGKPVWVVLPFVPDWRWLMDREDSPWYPNTRLFRQTVRADWVELFERVAQRLRSVIAGDSPVWAIAERSLQLRDEDSTDGSRRIASGASPGTPAIEIDSGPSPQLINGLAKLLSDSDYVAAASLARQIAERFPRDGVGWKLLGVALSELRQSADALAAMQRSVALMPDDAEAHNNLGNTQSALKRLDDAMASYRRALVIKPDYAEAHNNLGVAQKDLRKLDAAVVAFRRALEINSAYANAQYNLGLALLLMGNFEEGWKHNESRADPKLKYVLLVSPKVTFPQWQGQSLAGKSILVWYEQGLGDQIQFCRYLSILKTQGAARMTLVCSSPLKSLLQRLNDADGVVNAAETDDIPAHDYWTFPLSIPLYCATTLGNVPAAIPYLYADADHLQDSATRLAGIREFKVGVCWQGGSAYPKDGDRSPGLDPFKTLFRLGGVRYFTLQPGSRDQFLAVAGSTAHDLGHEIDEFNPPFEETAALIMNLDLVITCDTAVGHVAGALGKPVWVVLPFVPDWRWLMDREDSPWYPNTRLFRQSSRGDWGELFVRVARRLESVVAGESTAVWPIATTH